MNSRPCFSIFCRFPLVIKAESATQIMSGSSKRGKKEAVDKSGKALTAVKNIKKAPLKRAYK